ncbi:MAG: riboflavin synthase [Ignavibacteriota bacterium]
MSDMKEGASIAVNGVCLTAVDLRPDSFSADLAPETLRRSNLGDLRPGSRVNLERPLSPSGRLDGHIVQGHVDATANFCRSKGSAMRIGGCGSACRRRSTASWCSRAPSPSTASV